MQFIVKKRDELSRIGEIVIDDKRIVTPSILSVYTNRFKPFDKADLILSDIKIKINKPVFKFPEIPFKLDEKK